MSAPYGEWPSPIAASSVARGRLRLSFPSAAGGRLWWQESRPEEDGRTTVVCLQDGDTQLSLPAPWNARTRVHEYGGRSYLPVPMPGESGWGLVFANFSDQRLYLTELTPGTPPLVRALTPRPPEPAALRYADFALPAGKDVIWCVRERHEPDGTIVRAIVSVPLDGSAVTEPDLVREIAVGADFFAFPTPSPDGRLLAWICWNHPDMPWDGTELRVGPAAETTTGRTIMGSRTESVLAPCWRDDETLYAVSDRSGWWNVHRVGTAPEQQPRPVHPVAEEFAEPPWSLGGRSLALLDDGRLAVLHGVGESRLSLLDPGTGELTRFDTPYTEFDHALAVDGTTLVCVAGGPTRSTAVLRVDTDTGAVAPVRTELADLPPEGFLPTATPMEFAGEDGATVHALVYPPSNPEVRPLDAAAPPYVIWAHGGPTGRSAATLDLMKVYFTSRGIGIADVNYSGSSGYGRAYRERLCHRWGVADVADLVTVGRALADRGIADGARLAIRGPSSGGASALAAVTTGVVEHGPVFAAAVSYFGVSDLSALAVHTHDFESHYLDGLIGPLPRSAEIYRQRSAIGHVQPQTCPVLLLQGMDDLVVPPAQSAAVAAELARYNVEHACINFPGESHGFRKAETVTLCLRAELSFCGQVLGFTPTGIPRIHLSGGHVSTATIEVQEI